MVAGYFEIEYIFLLQDKFTKTAAEITKSVGLLRSEINKLNNGLNKAATETSHFTKNVNKLKKPLAQATKGTKKFGNELDRAKRKAVNLTASINKASQALYRVGSFMGTTVTLPVMGAAYGGARSFLDVEKEFVGLQRKTGSTRKQVLNFLPSLLKATVTDVDSNKVAGAFNTRDLVSMMTGFGGAGIGGDIKDKAQRMRFLQGFAEVAKKGQIALDIPNTAEMERFSKLIVKLGDLKTPRQFEDILDVMNAIADTGVVTERELVSAMQSKGISDALTYFDGQAFSTRIEKVMAMQEAAISLGMSPRRGASFMQALQSRFVTKDKEIPEAVRRQFFQDPMKALIGLLESSKTRDGFKQINFLKDVLGSEYSAKGSALKTKNVIDTLKKRLAWIESVDKSGIAATFEKFGITQYRVNNAFMMTIESVDKQLEMFGNNLKNIGIQLFSLLAEDLLALLKSFNKAAPKIIEFFEQHPNIAKVSMAFAAMAAATGPFLMLLGSLGQIAVSFMVLKDLGIGKVIADIGLWSTKIGGALAGAITAPAAITALVAGLVAYKGTQGVMDVIGKDDNIWNQFWDNLWFILKEDVLPKLESNIKSITKDFLKGLADIMGFINTLNPMKYLNDILGILFENIGNLIRSGFSGMTLNVVDWVYSHLQGDRRETFGNPLVNSFPDRYGNQPTNAPSNFNPTFVINPNTGKVTETDRAPLAAKPFAFEKATVAPLFVGRTDTSK